VIALEVADLVVIASRTLQLDTDQVLELLDPTAADHALAEARSGRGSDDPATRAAVLLHALVRQRRCGVATNRWRWRPCCSSSPSTAGR
jgi:hypothetical protein